MVDAKGLVIAAPASGAGKTLVTLGLLRAFTKRGLAVSSAKVGPDYIDPHFHQAASGRACFNLDGWAMRGSLVSTLAANAVANSELLLVEGVMGLFDGAAGGDGSTADMAADLGLPIVLVVDAGAQGQSVAALVKGFAEFQDNCDVGGVVFNRVTSQTHEELLRHAVENIGVPVFGSLRRETDLDLPSRHLGLVQASEHGTLEAFIERAAQLVAEAVDLDALTSIARPLLCSGDTPALPPLGQRIAVARDEAFGFSYPHLLNGWRDQGAEVLPFSPLADEAPNSNADAVYLPGGYPELHAGRLAGNATFLNGLRSAADGGVLIFGECGGFMVLGDYLIDADGKKHAMAGLLPLGTSFAERGLTLGYRKLEHGDILPWPARLRGHEFHYSKLHWQGGADPLFAVQDSRNKDLGHIGLRHGRVMGSYAHVIDMEDET
ncbi:MAG: cobyrinate a,c-diamide synthase [Hyphomicrobiaceae bacterium]|nr:cobyrinate a,c-diamide synthase [Hyphomicrobiaceae bacterium]